MTLLEILAVAKGVFKFWDQVVWLVKFLQKTPEEKHMDLMKRLQSEADGFEKTGRPTWD